MTGLLDLPAEALRAICRHFCLHCVSNNSGPDGFVETGSDGRASLADLYHLSQTCTALHEHAQSILYHCPFTVRDSFVSLVRTIAKQPALAQAVKQLHVGEGWNLDPDEVLSSEDVAYFDNLMAKYPRDANGEPIQMSPQWTLQGPPRGSHRSDRLDYRPEIALAALIVTQTPNIERLRIVTYYNWEFPFCQPGSLPRLTDLRLEHGDTEMGVGLNEINGILAVAPSLERLSGHMVAGATDLVRHKNLTEVDLSYSSMRLDSFTAVMSSFEKLQRFSYASGGSTISDMGEATPREISQAVLIRRDTLRHLCLDLRYAERVEDLEEEDAMESLKDMQVLETIKLYGTCIYAETEDESTTDGALLTQFLPSSIQSFSIDSPHKHILPDILQLAKDVPGQFPKLKEVRFMGVDEEDQGALKAAFAARKILALFPKDSFNF